MTLINGITDRIDEIENLIAQDEMTRSQVFTQMKQLVLRAKLNENKIKAEAVREAAKKLQEFNIAKGQDNINAFEIRFFNLCADKIERGEL